MRKISIYLFCGIAILFFTIIVSGCVTPPQEIPEITPLAGNTNTISPTVTGTSTYLTQATLFPTPIAPYAVATTVPLPEEKVCLIGLTSLNATFNPFLTADSFDLKNPPMYINYTITNTFNETGINNFESKYGLGEQSVSYSYYSPYSYLEITVRNKTTGDIYADDGFGLNYGYFLNKSFRVMNRDDMLIEIKAFNLTATVGIWVKPDGNGVNASGLECQHYSDFGPNTLNPQ
jgi:hypothetical protein